MVPFPPILKSNSFLLMILMTSSFGQTTIPQKFGARKLVVPEKEPLTEEVIVTEADQEQEALQQQEITEAANKKQKHYSTNYEANNATIDCPMHMDLAADETVESLMMYTANLGSTALEPANSPSGMQ